MTIGEQKIALRKEAIRTRHQLSHLYDAQASEKAAGHALTLLTEAGAKTVALYWPLGDELDTRPLIRDLNRAGYVTLLPVVVDKDAPMVFRPWDMGDPLEKGKFGVMEPLADAPEMQPDAVILPLLAFDEAGGRLGWGAGCYDRTLAELPDVPAYGFAYAGQMVNDVPMEEHDRRLNAVITETGVIKAES